MPLMTTNAGPPPGWTPAMLPGVLDNWSIAAMRAGGRLFQDAGKTTLALADGDPVRVVSGSIDYSAAVDARRPLLKTDGAGHWWLLFDGVDDMISGSRTINQPFAAWASVQSVSGNAFRVMDSNGRCLFGGDFSTSIYQLYASGAGVLTAAGEDRNAQVLQATFNGASSFLYRDNSAVISGNPGVTGTSGIIYIGNDNGGGTPSNMKLFGFGTTSTVPSATDQTTLFNYLKGLHP